MAGSSLLALIDDIATTLDDVAMMTKVAAKKTAGVLGDDLALNAQQVAGVNADRELPVVWSVAMGSVVNKLILIPISLAISEFFPALITPLLMAGGLFLCFEGAEKIVEKFLHKTHRTSPEALVPEGGDPHLFEKEKIKGAVRTDFILSAEIIVITLGSVAATTFMNRVLVMFGIGAAMTIGVYGFVALIVKLDDVGLWMVHRQTPTLKPIGRGLLLAAPMLMRFLGVAGTIAMFLVGGGILSHGVPGVHHFQETLGTFSSSLFDLGVGLTAGAGVLASVNVGKRLRR
jgi:predicted DNA repair protein MutK